MLVRNLSGGNQQKVVIAKWLTVKPKILILDEPTRGIDVGAKTEIYSLMREFVKAGVGIIMVSSELPELLGMSDRVVCIAEGHVAGILDHSEATPERVMWNHRAAKTNPAKRWWCNDATESVPQPVPNLRQKRWMS